MTAPPTKLEKRTTVRITAALDASIRGAAAAAGVSPTVMTRSLILEGLLSQARKPDPPRSTATVATVGTGSEHRVKLWLDEIPEDATDDAKERISTRNEVLFTMHCSECDAPVEPQDTCPVPEVPPAPLRVVRPSVSPGRALTEVRPPVSSRRFPITAFVHHDPACAGAGSSS